MKLLSISLLLFSFGIVRGQQQPVDSADTHSTPLAKVKKDTRPIMERIRFGGSTGFWVNAKQTHLELAGLMAYDFPKILTTGFGYRYIFTRNLLYGKNLNSYGPNLFARAQLSRHIYLWSEWEQMNSEYAYQVGSDPVATAKTSVNSFFGGMGYIRRIGKKGRGGVSAQVLYNFLYDQEPNSPYYSPVIYRVGYFF